VSGGLGVGYRASVLHSESMAVSLDDMTESAYSFLLAELSVANTLLDLAGTSEDHATVRKNVSHAIEALVTIDHYLHAIDLPEVQMTMLAAARKNLRNRLDQFLP